MGLFVSGSSHLGVKASEPIGDGGGVFFKKRKAWGAIDVSGAFVVAEFVAGDEFRAIHDVGLKEDDWALVEAIGEEVASPEGRMLSDFFGETVGRVVLIGGQSGLGGEGVGEGFGEGDFELGIAGEEADEHLKAFVVVHEFARVVAAVDQDVVVLARERDGGGGGIEVQAEDEIGLDLMIDELGSGPNLRCAVKKLFCLLDRCQGREEILRSGSGNGFIFFADKAHLGAEGFELGLDFLASEQSHFTLTDGEVVTIAQLPFFHLGEVATNVAGI